MFGVDLFHSMGFKDEALSIMYLLNSDWIVILLEPTIKRLSGHTQLQSGLLPFEPSQEIHETIQLFNSAFKTV